METQTTAAVLKRGQLSPKERTDTQMTKIIDNGLRAAVNNAHTSFTLKRPVNRQEAGILQDLFGNLRHAIREHDGLYLRFHRG